MKKSLRHNPLPDFAVIGSMRAGTTMLQDLLDGVQGICLARMKETDFFIKSKNYHLGKSWYEGQFKRRQDICGEISPNYTKRDVFPEAAELLYKSNPNAKLIYIVRDPVARAISQFNHTFLMSGKPEIENLLDSHEGRHILNTSRYAWQIEPWLETFGRKSVLIVDFKDITKNTSETIKDICSFIGAGEDITVSSQHSISNSTEQIGALPVWWKEMRENPLGNAIRASMPRNAVRLAKKILTSRAPLQNPPKIPHSIKSEIRKMLSEDTERFREITGLPFAEWDEIVQKSNEVT
ncbi:MAG: sulfotransferase domain-containing protein [Alphaproteobacteria bacterium]|nr:sulfotransferase domain-containing protein [Alphaproteobacteria bacterium]